MFWRGVEAGPIWWGFSVMTVPLSMSCITVAATVCEQRAVSVVEIL